MSSQAPVSSNESKGIEILVHEPSLATMSSVNKKVLRQGWESSWYSTNLICILTWELHFISKFSDCPAVNCSSILIVGHISNTIADHSEPTFQKIDFSPSEGDVVSSKFISPPPQLASFIPWAILSS